MSRKVSFIVLLVILLAIAFLFFKVMANFVLPIFLALLLVVVFGPLHRWFLVKCQGRGYVAAGLTTAAILAICLLPLSVVFVQAGLEGVRIYDQISADAAGLPTLDRLVNALDGYLPVKLSTAEVQQTLQAKAQQWLGPLVLGTTKYAGSTLIGLVVMIVAIYYFLADGPSMVRQIMRLSPLEDRYEQQLVEQFENISRAVVLATLLSAVTQGILGGLGYWLAGLDSVFLLIMLTMLLAMVPFVGAAAVWAPVCLWLFFHEGRVGAAVLLAVYGVAVISMADNVIKPLVLRGRSNLHPLLGLLSVIGGVQALGPIGIFVGPMVVVFFHTVLNMVQAELDILDQDVAARDGS